MNKLGQHFMVGAMLAFIAFFVAVIFIEPLKTEADAARVSLNCSGDNLTTGVSLTCIVTDVYLFVFTFTLLGVGASLIGLRRTGFLGGG